MNIGDGVLAYHESFRNATDNLQHILDTYIDKNKLNNINFLITGHSRGAAVANILAADLVNGNYEVSGTKKICAYGFATPNYCKDLKDDGCNYDNIFNFCFADDFVTRVPLEKWGFGKLGVTFWAVADGLVKINTSFKNFSESQNLVFNEEATKKVIQDVYEVAKTVNEYNNKDLYMGPFDNPSKTPLHSFMRNYVAMAIIDVKNGKLISSSAVRGLAAKAALSYGNDVHKIADFFVDNADVRISIGTDGVKFSGEMPKAEQYIFDTHDMLTYKCALRSNGFRTQ